MKNHYYRRELFDKCSFQGIRSAISENEFLFYLDFEINGENDRFEITETFDDGNLKEVSLLIEKLAKIEAVAHETKEKLTELFCEFNSVK